MPRLTQKATVQQTSTLTSSGKQYTPPTSPKASDPIETAKVSSKKTGNNKKKHRMAIKPQFSVTMHIKF